MSRRRSTDPHHPITIAIPRSIKTRLDELLSYRQSRSKWICNAIVAKLDAIEAKTQTIDAMSNSELLFELFYRNAIAEDIYMMLKAKLLVEETAE
tara:strand:+ start:927 stop:1211 length:285 start_codon:yes stop_codon:yes gene_type:complete